MSVSQYNPTLGPFLPLSPMEATFFRANNQNNRGQARSNSASSTSSYPIPRHISTSAYLTNSLGVDSKNITGILENSDRQASFAAAAAVSDLSYDAIGDDTLSWEGNEGHLTPRSRLTANKAAEDTVPPTTVSRQAIIVSNRDEDDG